MSNCRSRCVDYNLTNGFCPKGSGRLITVLKLNLQAAHIQSGGNFILHKGILNRLSMFIIGNIFHQCHANALYQSAFCLNSSQCRIDSDTAIHHSLVIQYGYQTGLFIQLDFYHTYHKGRRRHRGRMAGSCDSGCIGIRLCLISDIGYAYRLVCLNISDSSPFKSQLLFFTV